MTKRDDTINTLNTMLGDIDHATDEYHAMTKREHIHGAACLANRLGLITMEDWEWYDNEAARACERRYTELAERR